MTGSDGPPRRDFDRDAAFWDEKPDRVRMAGDVASAIEREIPLDRSMDVLDFGCGTGLLSLHLAPRIGTLTAVDGSRGMLDVLDGKIERLGLTAVRTRLVDLEGDDPLGGPYHLAVSSMTLHHIVNVPSLLRRVQAALHPGGRLAVADLDREGGRFHRDRQGVFHEGFERRLLAGDLAAAGFVSVRAVTASRLTKKTREGDAAEFTVFLMIADKPVEREGTR